MKFIMFFIIFYAKLYYHLTSMEVYFLDFLRYSYVEANKISMQFVSFFSLKYVGWTYLELTFFIHLLHKQKCWFFSWFIYFHIGQTKLTNGKVNGDFLETIILTNSKFWKKKMFEGQYFRILSLSIIVLKCAIDSACSRPKSFFCPYNTVCSTLQHYISFSL